MKCSQAFKGFKYLFIVSITMAILPLAGSKAADHIVMKWQNDNQWKSTIDPWTLNNVDLVGQNGGLRLERKDLGYAAEGYATYHYSPGSVNAWKGVSAEEGSVSEARTSIWLSVHDKDTLAQLAPDGTIIKEWSVGKDPSRVAMGCDSDVWVANRSLVDGGTNLANSISHIIPLQNKVVTRAFSPNITNPTAISVQCSEGSASVWVGVENDDVFYRIDADEFDGLAEGTAIDPTATASGDPVSLGCTGECTLGSVLSQDGKFLYVLGRTKVMKIDTTSLTKTKEFTISSGQMITKDNRGNIWVTDGDNNTIYRIDSAENLSTLNVNLPTAGITVIPPGEPLSAEILAFTNKATGALCKAEITGNDTAAPTLGTITCADAPPENARGSGISYDPVTKDIWLTLKDAAKVYKYSFSSNYLSAQAYDSNTLQGTLDSYADFVGTTYSEDNQHLEYQFSTDNQTWYSKDDFNAGRLPNSSDLYIMVRFYGNTYSSPVLKSLSVSYDIVDNNFSGVILEKKTFLAEGAGSLKYTATIEPGNDVVARIKIKSANAISGASLTDIRPNTGLSGVSQIGKAECGLGNLDNLSQQNFSIDSQNNVSWKKIDLAAGAETYFCYKFKLDYTKDKNELIQARAILSAPSTSNNNENSILATSNNYYLMKGLAYLASDSTTKEFDSATSPLYEINDELNPSNSAYVNETNSGKSVPFYVYERGFGSHSRGGNLLNLPVTVSSGGEDIAFDQSYLLYNPAFYLFGNIFSGSNYAGNALDFNSRFGSISNKSADDTNKQNGESALYGYYFDKESVVYWGDSASGGSDEYKNKIMADNISKYTATATPDIECKLSDANKLKTSPLNFQTNDCANLGSMADKGDSWPNGRVWYLSTETNTINLGPTNGSAANVYGRGTLIVDFKNEGANKVIINNLSFVDQAKLGLIVLGGDVEFSRSATSFKGIIFNPSNSSRNTYSGGKVTFISEGEPLKIYGSIVAEEIAFNKRKKSGSYGIAIYSDAKLMNQPLPAFEGINSVLTGK